MDKITDKLNHHSKKPHHPAIQAAMKLAEIKLNRYYATTDTSSAYRIAMILHPALKLEYFRAHDWKREWIRLAEQLVRDEYTKNYQGKAECLEENLYEADDKALQSAFDAEFGDFANFTTGIISVPTSELDDYLKLPVEKAPDPLKWWHNHRRVYPNLSRMALDYLSIPGESDIATSGQCADLYVPATSTAVERVFSQGRQLLHFTRNTLSTASIRAFLCLGSWCRSDIISSQDLVSSLSSNKRKAVPIIDITTDNDADTEDGFRR